MVRECCIRHYKNFLIPRTWREALSPLGYTARPPAYAHRRGLQQTPRSVSRPMQSGIYCTRETIKLRNPACIRDPRNHHACPHRKPRSRYPRIIYARRMSVPASHSTHPSACLPPHSTTSKTEKQNEANSPIPRSSPTPLPSRRRRPPDRTMLLNHLHNIIPIHPPLRPPLLHNHRLPHLTAIHAIPGHIPHNPFLAHNSLPSRTRMPHLSLITTPMAPPTPAFIARPSAHHNFLLL